MTTTAPIQAMTGAYAAAASLWLKQAEAWSAAMRSAIVLSARDITIYFPFGHGYRQDIDPRTNWGWVGASATNWPELEEEIVRRVASYGAQLDTVIELLLDVAKRTPETDADKIKALEDLVERIDGLKLKHGRI